MPKDGRNLKIPAFSYILFRYNTAVRLILNPIYFGLFWVTVALAFPPVIVRITGGVVEAGRASGFNCKPART
jgi:hypothetical protein